MYFLIRPKAGSELLINYIGIYLTEFACGIIGTGIFLVKLKLHFGFLLRNIDQIVIGYRSCRFLSLCACCLCGTFRSLCCFSAARRDVPSLIAMVCAST